MAEVFEIWVAEKLSAQRKLTGFPGKFALKHNHIYRLEFQVEADGIDDNGVTCDFAVLQNAIAKSIADLQGAYLNDVADIIDCSPEDNPNPTGEVVARVVRNRAAAAIDELGFGLKLKKVVVAESPSGKIAYSK